MKNFKKGVNSVDRNVALIILIVTEIQLEKAKREIRDAASLFIRNELN